MQEHVGTMKKIGHIPYPDRYIETRFWERLGKKDGTAGWPADSINLTNAWSEIPLEWNVCSCYNALAVSKEGRG